ncbi:hypothetical protein [Micromonospora sp. SH-82]|uniref:hypothetical protein n=1 Tax=Micromonospora sp. SH-82 TaxID=3132938 RepID=UPI003EBE4D2A
MEDPGGVCVEGQGSANQATQSMEALLLDYEMAREDERTYINVQASLYGVAIALIALILGALTQECGLGMKQPPECTDAPDAILAAAPILPLGLIAFIQSLGSVASIRSYYMRGLEVELGRYASQPMAALGELRPVSYIGLTTELISLRRGFLSYRILFNTILLGILVVFGGMTVYIGLAVARPYQVAMIVLYGTVVVILLAQTFAATVQGSQLFRSVARRFVQGPRYSHLPQVRAAGSPGSTTPTDASSQRSLGSYLLLPRPEDLVKWLIAPLTYVVFALAFGGWTNWHRLLVLWLILEYLVYMARYQWNDVREVADDWEHSESAARGRLPIGRDLAESSSNVSISVSVAMLRLALAVLVAWSAGLTVQAVSIIVAVFGVAVPYELLRSRAMARRRGVAVAIWLLVGSGYAIRGALGIVAAGIQLWSPPGLAGVGFLFSFGIMFVLLTWVLDASSYGRIAPDGGWSFRPALLRKPHLLGLLPYTSVGRPVMADRDDEAESNREYGGDRRLLLQSRPRPWAPWNLAQVAVAASAAALGLELADPASRQPAVYMTALACGVVIALLIQQIRNMRGNVLTIGVGVGLLGVVALAGDAAFPPLAPLPWLVMAVTYLNFRGSSYRDLKDFGPKLVDGLRRIPTLLLRGVVGSVTWDRLVKPGGRPGGVG